MEIKACCGVPVEESSCILIWRVQLVAHLQTVGDTSMVGFVMTSSPCLHCAINSKRTRRIILPYRHSILAIVKDLVCTRLQIPQLGFLGEQLAKTIDHISALEDLTDLEIAFESIVKLRKSSLFISFHSRFSSFYRNLFYTGVTDDPVVVDLQILAIGIFLPSVSKITSFKIFFSFQ
jgi:hypothetical protein